jgi:hypothetical protein
MILVLVAILLALAAPAMLFLRDWKKNGKVNETDSKNGEIQSGLYGHLFEQVTALTKRLDTMSVEYNTMVRENAELKARVAALESCEELVRRLQAKLDLKDEIIIERDAQLNAIFADLRARDQVVSELQGRCSVRAGTACPGAAK